MACAQFLPGHHRVEPYTEDTIFLRHLSYTLQKPALVTSQSSVMNTRSSYPLSREQPAKNLGWQCTLICLLQVIDAIRSRVDGLVCLILSRRRYKSFEPIEATRLGITAGQLFLRTAKKCCIF